MKPKTKIVELVVSDENEALTIDAISLVTSPAIQENFVFFGKEKNNLTLAKVDEEKRELISPALIPNKQIFRYDPNTDSEYYVYFSKETVKQASYLYLKHNNHHKATEQHTDRVSGVLTVESWIKEGEQDKSNMYGFDLPVGTWFVKMKIENDEIWQRIKSGELKGLSIEGYFVNSMEKMGKQEPTVTDEQILQALNEIIKDNKMNKKYFENLAKAKKVVKVELNTQKDLYALLDEFWKHFDKAVLPFDKVEGILKSMIKSGEKAKLSAKEYIKKAEDFNSKIKELGVSEKEAKAGSYVKQKKEDIKSADNWIRVIKKFIADAKNVD